MKELSIEEKAKAYDKALKVAKDIRNGEAAYIPDGTPVIEAIFPELKEPEDGERIRKELIAFLKENHETGRADETWSLSGIERWIAWLEKQGNPTDINPSEFDLRLNKLLKQFETLPKEELANSLSFYLNVVQNDGTYKPDEKQGEQKPNPCDGCINRKGCINCENGELREVEQKHAEWSEEDEQTIEDAEAWLDTLCDYLKDNSSECIPLIKVLINKLKSLKDRVQPKQEWSEEDEERIKNILSVLDVQVCWDGATGKKGNPYQKEINWLKSLKNRYAWKPSDEQMDALLVKIPIENGCNKVDNILKSLYSDLKKLK